MVGISKVGFCSGLDLNALKVMTGPGGAAIWPLATRHRDQPQLLMADSARTSDRRACSRIRTEIKLEILLV
jgi:hypothetical protein